MAKKSGVVNKEAEKELLEGLTKFRDALRKGEKIQQKFTCHRVAIDLVPHTYTPKLVKEVRELLGLSQALFGQFLGVSPKTVRAWEAGNDPSGMACRFMDEIRRDPSYWRKRLASATKSKTA